MLIFNMMMIMNDNDLRTYYQSLWGGWGCSGGPRDIYQLSFNRKGHIQKRRKGWGWKLPTIPQELLRDIHLVGNEIYSSIRLEQRLQILRDWQYWQYQQHQYGLPIADAPYFISGMQDLSIVHIIDEFICEHMGWLDLDEKDINSRIHYILSTTMNKWITEDVFDMDMFDDIESYDHDSICNYPNKYEYLEMGALHPLHKCRQIQKTRRGLVGNGWGSCTGKPDYFWDWGRAYSGSWWGDVVNSWGWYLPQDTIIPFTSSTR